MPAPLLSGYRPSRPISGQSPTSCATLCAASSSALSTAPLLSGSPRSPLPSSYYHSGPLLPTPLSLPGRESGKFDRTRPHAAFFPLPFFPSRRARRGQTSQESGKRGRGISCHAYQASQANLPTGPPPPPSPPSSPRPPPVRPSACPHSSVSAHLGLPLRGMSPRSPAGRQSSTCPVACAPVTLSPIAGDRAGGWQVHSRLYLVPGLVSP